MVQPRLCCLLLAISLIPKCSCNGGGVNTTSSIPDPTRSNTTDVNSTSHENHETTVPFTTGGSTLSPMSLSPLPTSPTPMSTMGAVFPTSTVREMSSAPTATPENPSDPGEDDSSSSVALVAVGIGILLGFLLAIIVVIVVVILAITVVMRRKRSATYKTEQSQGPAIANTLYTVSPIGKGGADPGNGNLPFTVIGPNSNLTMPREYDEIKETKCADGPHEYSYATTENKPPLAPLDYSYSYATVSGKKPQATGHEYFVLTSERNRSTSSEEETYMVPAKDEHSLYAQFSKMRIKQILSEDVITTDQLGSGQFGMVDRGVWQSTSGPVDVAVKTLKPDSKEEDKVKFLQEAAIMGQFSHPNVVRLFGVVTVGEPMMIVLELLQKGDLRNHLLSLQQETTEDTDEILPHMLLSYCRQIASGMEYLCRKAFIHRDLAARNILVAEDCTCKVADFGMSRDLVDENYYISHGGKVPVKWTAPEALHFRKYSTASDVWGYGTVMYEIWSLGHKPFEEYTNAQCMKMVDARFRLPPPPGCPRTIYDLMIKCWHPKTSDRPRFTEIVQCLSRPDTTLLKWKEEDKMVHPKASLLGTKLQGSARLYKDLQMLYDPDKDYSEDYEERYQ